ncbi:MAG: 4-hydroxythreonine-4-phosphate dehydrogenase [Symbiobacteriaceae bacterium]|jgi:4-hydroxythreonine-4-phosphate dehydrogenase|nr:4-hydroxythreonine-4-phosphate dehydrogenase [Symbiobacteriaceae bacterium]
MGDPAGVGTEVILKAVKNPRAQSAARCLVVGDAAWMAAMAAKLDINVAVRPVSSVAEAKFIPGTVDVLDLKNAPVDRIQIGTVSAAGGKAAVEAVQVAANLALQGLVDAIATAPLNKEAMHMAGYKYPGHTELLAEMTATQDYSMLLVTPTLRCFFVTVHVSLRKAIDLITADRVRRIIGVAQSTLQRIGIAEPRIAVAGLNPHAGENGMFGDEEIREIIPGVGAAREAGINATGPWPPDTVFAKAMAGQYDAVISMYHDQGHIPIKLAGFSDGVNVTAGLPIIRTSVDHGTAFDIAGKGIADEGSMVEAITLAARLSGGAQKA